MLFVLLLQNNAKYYQKKNRITVFICASLWYHCIIKVIRSCMKAVIKKGGGDDRIMKKVMRFFNGVAKVMNVIAIIALLIMICVTLADVFMRLFFTAPITGAVEITRMMMVTMSPAFVGALLEHRHVSVGLIVDRFGRKGQLIFDTVGYLLTFGLCSIYCYQGFVEMFKKMSQKQVYTMLKIPTWPFYLIFSVSMGVFAIVVLVQLIYNYWDKDVYAKPAAKENGGDQA